MWSLKLALPCGLGAGVAGLNNPGCRKSSEQDDANRRCDANPSGGDQLGDEPVFEPPARLDHLSECPNEQGSGEQDGKVAGHLAKLLMVMDLCCFGDPSLQPLSALRGENCAAGSDDSDDGSGHD